MKSMHDDEGNLQQRLNLWGQNIGSSDFCDVWICESFELRDYGNDEDGDRDYEGTLHWMHDCIFLFMLPHPHLASS